MSNKGEHGRAHTHHTSASETDPGLASSTTASRHPGSGASESLSPASLSSSHAVAAAEPLSEGPGAEVAARAGLTPGPAVAGLNRRSRSMAEVARASAAWREAKNRQGAAVARQAAAIPVWESKSTLFWEGDSR